jgi:hypothetical protein
MFRGILKLLAEHQEEAQSLAVRIKNEYVPIDPRIWETEFDMTVNVGLGTGTKDQQMQHLTNIIMLQGQMAQSPLGQMFPPNVLYEKFHNAVGKLAETAGFKDPNLFFPDPKEIVPPQPQPPPEVQKAQMQIEADKEKQAAEMQMRGQEMQQEAALKERELFMEMALEKMKAMMSAELERFKIGLQAQVQERVGMANALNKPRPEMQ